MEFDSAHDVGDAGLAGFARYPRTRPAHPRRGHLGWRAPARDRQADETEFPSDWDDDKIIGHILDVARAPDDPPVFQANHRWRVHGQRDNVGITVIGQPDGRIWSAWPDADSPGVVKNPKETK